MVFQQIMNAPKQIVSELTHNPIWFGAGVVSELALNNYWTAAGLPTGLITKIDKMEITMADVGQAAVGAGLAAYGHKLPVIGSMLGQGGWKAIGAGVMGAVAYNKIQQEFPVLPTIKSGMGIVPFGRQPFSQAYFGGNGFRSFTGNMTVV